MKSLLLKAIIVLLPLFSIAQKPYPDCNDLRVEKIEMDNDTAYFMKITIKNNCDDCASGINGPVYCEVTVVRNIAPYDTIATSLRCFCNMTPYNNSSLVYHAFTNVAALPPVNQLKVFLYCGSGLCDEIPFSATFGSNQEINIFPNPVTSIVTVTNPERKNLDIQIHDAAGRLVFQKNNITDSEAISFSKFLSGLYYITVQNKTDNLMKTFKTLK